MIDSKNLADKIVLFFERYDMMGGATSQELYQVILKALDTKDEEEIKIIKDYFRDIRWTNKRAQGLYREIDLYYSK